MFLTPLLVRVAPHVTAGERLLAPLERLIGVKSADEIAEERAAISGHVVIVGYGVAGKLAANALTGCDQPFVILELNAETVQLARSQGIAAYYGDATSEEALGHAHLAEARLVILLMNDPQAAQRVVDTLRRVAPSVPILMRTRYLSEREMLLRMGARDVVAEEVEGAAEVVSRMLRWLETPRNVMEERIHELRAATQTTERKLSLPRPRLGDVTGLSELKIESVLVKPGSAAAGQSPVSMDLRKKTGALVVSVRRGTRLLDQPDPRVPFEVGDVVYLVGTTDQIRAVMPLFDADRSLHEAGD